MRIKSSWICMLVSVSGLTLSLSAEAKWPMYNHDPSGSRYNAAEHRLGPNNVGDLAVEWSFTTAGAVSATPAVKGGKVYAGDMSGAFYALNAKTGSLIWSTQVHGAVSASAMVLEDRIVFGDLAGYIYGLDRDTGAIQWEFRPSPHPLSAIYGSGTRVGRHVAFGVASNEEPASGDPNYPCCSSRGSVLLINPKNGHVLWQTQMITDAELAAGASGSSVWASPSYDPALGLIYVGTGNNYTQPTTGTSDSLVALDAMTGEIVWLNQLVANDEWNFRFPFSTEHPDSDFADSPQIYRLPDGHKVVGAGQKNGFYQVLDARTGALINQQQYEVASDFGGLFSDSAIANGVVYADGTEVYTPAPPTKGDLVAITSDGATELWRFSVQDTGFMSGVAVANGVVYLSALNGDLYALDAQSGALLKQLAIGGSASGPSVTGGRVYVGTGDVFGPAAPASILRLGAVNVCDDDDDDELDDD